MSENNNETKTKRHGAMSGRASLFRGKVRAPVSLTLTPHHHDVVNRNKLRLGLTRSDFIALLIDRYADVVELDSIEHLEDADEFARLLMNEARLIA